LFLYDPVTEVSRNVNIASGYTAARRYAGAVCKSQMEQSTVDTSVLLEVR